MNIELNYKHKTQYRKNYSFTNNKSRAKLNFNLKPYKNGRAVYALLDS